MRPFRILAVLSVLAAAFVIVDVPDWFVSDLDRRVCEAERHLNALSGTGSDGAACHHAIDLRFAVALFAMAVVFALLDRKTEPREAPR